MAFYDVTLRNSVKPEKTKTVRIEAPNQAMSMEIATEAGWRAGKASLVEGGDAGKKKYRRLNGKLLVRVCRSLGLQLRAKLQLKDALMYYAARLEDKNLRTALNGVVEHLRMGYGAGKAFEMTGLFDPMFIGLIKAGEVSGSLADSLFGVAKFTSIRVEATSKIRKAITMPLATMVFVAAIFVAAMTNLTPKIEGMLTGFNIEPDPFSAAVFTLSHIVQAVWFPVTILLIGAVVTLALSAEARSKVVIVIMARVKMVREMIMSYRQLLFLSTFQLLYANKIKVPNALETCAEILHGTPMSDELLVVADKYKRGEKLATALENYTHCDPEVSHKVGIGEESGTLEEQLELLVEFYESMLNDAISAFSGRMYITVLSIAGIMLGSCYVASYLPIMLMGPKMLEKML